MIQIISDALARWLELEGTISSNEHTLFTYAIYSCLFGLLPIGIVLVLGICLGMIQEGIIFISPFMLLRKFSGGFHLKSSRICLVVTTGTLALAMGLIKFIAHTGHTEILSFFVFISVGCLYLFSPIDNQARKLSDKERKNFCTTARMLSIGSLIWYVLLSRGPSILHVTALGVGIILVALLQIPCVLGKHLHISADSAKTTR